MKLSLPYRLDVDGETIVVREPVFNEEYRRLMDVQLRIWGMLDYSEAVTYHVLIASARNDGVVLGAFKEKGSEAIGLSFSFPGYGDGKTYLYSHLTGVISKYMYKGLGYV